MSGGHYGYDSNRGVWLAESIEEDAKAYAIPQTVDGRVRAAEPPHVIEAMIYCARELRRVSKLAHAIEWYMSSDYGPEAVAQAYAEATSDLTDQQIIDIAKSTKTAERGTAGYVLPVSFAREILRAYHTRS